MRKVEKAIAFALYTNPSGLTAQELSAKVVGASGVLPQMEADGIVELIDGRYFLTEIGQRAYIG